MLLAGLNGVGATMCVLVRRGAFGSAYLTDAAAGVYRYQFRYPSDVSEPIEAELFLPVPGNTRFPYGATVLPWVTP